MMHLGFSFWNLTDWLAFAVTLAGVWQLSSHKKSGFIVNVFGSCLWVAVGIHSGLSGLTGLNLILILIYLRGYIKK
ncbi:MAG: hypothetical protein ACYDDB_02180 [bacterium]